MMTDSLENCMKPNSASVHFLVRAANNGFRETLDNQSVNMNPRISQKIASTYPSSPASPPKKLGRVSGSVASPACSRTGKIRAIMSSVSFLRKNQ